VDALNELEKLKVHDSFTKIRTLVCEIIRHNLSIVSEIESSLKFLNIDVDNNFGLFFNSRLKKKKNFIRIFRFISFNEIN
jgi:hypothetical protein